MTRTRIFALTLVGLAFLSLGYLKVATADDPVSVPKGALAGDLLLDPCTYSTQDGNYAADCGTLVVPENRSDPQSRLIAVPVTRIRAQTDEPAEPIFRLEGGPGKTNMNFSMASRFVAERDVVLVGYRRHRRLGSSRLPGGRVCLEALHGSPRGEIPDRLR